MTLPYSWVVLDFSITKSRPSYRYYYAVIECDKLATARSIYEACDGAEFERSANFFDLRYIPDDMTFDDTPRDTANHAPENYKPLEYVTEVSRPGVLVMIRNSCTNRYWLGFATF